MPAYIVDTSHSPHARLRPVGVGQVRLADSFWAPRIQLNRDVSLPTQYEDIERTGRLDNFRRASGRLEADFRGACYDDSDVYKWMEACAWQIAANPEPEPDLFERLETVIDDVAAAQEGGGYLNTYFTFDRARDRWKDLARMHELYCGGHLIQAAVAHTGAVGVSLLFDVALRWAEHVHHHFLSRRRPGTPGHPEVEMALVELARRTGETRYLDLARYFIDQRGRGTVGGRDELQDRVPVRQASAAVGHAVRQLYLLAGAADLVAETGDAALRDALERSWRNLTERRMYVTGGCGSRYTHEAFGDDYELPNDRAYAETCAAVANLMFNWRMLLLTGEARFADVFERVLYNGFLAGWSLDGREYFYTNPLEHRGGEAVSPGRGANRRTRAMWDATACCPPNVARTIASLPGYFYSTSDGGVWAHLFAEGTAELNVSVPAAQVAIEQHTNYPWGGEVEFVVHANPEAEFTLHVRIPSWARTATLDGREVQPGTYAEVRRRWRDGDRVALSLPMPVERLRAHPHVANNRGRVALVRGPIIYCIEDADYPGASVLDLELPRDAELTAERVPDLLGGVTVLRGGAVVEDIAAWRGALYRPASLSLPGRCHRHTGRGEGPADGPSPPPSPWEGEGVSGRAVPLTAIPYYAWANRSPGAMQVWIAER